MRHYVVTPPSEDALNFIQRTLEWESLDGWYPLVDQDGAASGDGWARKIRRAGNELIRSVLDREEGQAPFPRPASNRWCLFPAFQRSEEEEPPFFRIVGAFLESTCPFLLDTTNSPTMSSWVTYGVARSVSCPALNISFKRKRLGSTIFVSITGDNDGTVRRIGEDDKLGLAYVHHVEHAGMFYDQRFGGDVPMSYLVLRMDSIMNASGSDAAATGAQLLEQREIFDVYLPVIEFNGKRKVSAVPFPFPSAATREALDVTLRTLMRGFLGEDSSGTSLPWGYRCFRNTVELFWTGPCLLALEGNSLPNQSALLAFYKQPTHGRFYHMQPSERLVSFGSLGNRITLVNKEEEDITPLPVRAKMDADFKHVRNVLLKGFKLPGVYRAVLDGQPEPLASYASQGIESALPMAMLTFTVERGVQNPTRFTLRIPVIIDYEGEDDEDLFDPEGSRLDFDDEEKDEVQRGLEAESRENWFPVKDRFLEGKRIKSGWPRKVWRVGGKLIRSVVNREEGHPSFRLPSRGTSRFQLYAQSRPGKKQGYRVVAGFRPSTNPFLLDMSNPPLPGAWVTYNLTATISPAMDISFRRKRIGRTTLSLISGSDDGTVRALTAEDIHLGLVSVVRLEEEAWDAYDDRFDAVVEMRYLVFRVHRFINEPAASSTPASARARVLTKDEEFELYIPALTFVKKLLVRPYPMENWSRGDIRRSTSAVLHTLFYKAPRPFRQARWPWWDVVAQDAFRSRLYWQGYCLIALAGSELPQDAAILAFEGRRAGACLRFEPKSFEDFGSPLGCRVVLGASAAGSPLLSVRDELSKAREEIEGGPGKFRKASYMEVFLDGPVATLDATAYTEVPLGRTALKMGMLNLLVVKGDNPPKAFKLAIPVILDRLSTTDTSTPPAPVSTGLFVAPSTADPRDRLYQRR